MRSALSFFVVVFVAFVFGAVACADEIVGTNEFRRTKATYTFDKSGSQVRFITAKDGKPSIAVDFKWKDANSQSTVGTAFEENGIIRGDAWFLYFESPQRIWMFDGVSDVYLIEYERSGDHGKSSVSSLKAGALGKAKCPPALFNALPEFVRDKFPTRS